MRAQRVRERLTRPGIPNRIAHVSDLQYGRHDATVAEAAIQDVAAFSPHIVVATGDLTQRARRRQFRQARAFLDCLPQPVLAVPGNHDVPLYDVVRRLAAPRARFRRFVGVTTPTWTNGSTAVLGVDSVRPLRAVEGFASASSIRGAASRLDAGDGGIRILAMHHPPRLQGVSGRLARRNRQALEAAAIAGVDMVLVGHAHRASVRLVDGGPTASPRSMVLVVAGTTTSTRRGIAPNHYHRLTVRSGGIRVEARSFDGVRFAGGQMWAFERAAAGWRPAAEPPE